MTRAKWFVVGLLSALIATGINAQVKIIPANGITGGGQVLASQILAVDGSASAPSYSFATSPTTGLYLAAANNPSMAISGNRVHNFTSTTFDVLNDSGAFRLGSSGDTILTRDAANILALRNGANAQTFRVYGTYTDASNYERLKIAWATNVADIFTENAGTGTLRSLRLRGNELYLGSNGADRWFINTSGHLLANTDNTYDIGASAATSARSVYASTSFVGNAATGALVSHVAQSVANDGVISLGTNAVAGHILVLSAEDGRSALFELQGSNNAVANWTGSASFFTTTATTASRINVYWSAANSRYELENKRGATRTIRVIRLGV